MMTLKSDNCINMLELRLIVDNIKRYGGFREKDILINLTKIEISKNYPEDYKVYVLYGNDNNKFEYNFKNHTIIG